MRLILPLIVIAQFFCTLLFAIFTISNRFSSSLVFLVSALWAGLFNLGIPIPQS
jgi:hypothetical protein